jgi:hypothetical protein
MDVFLIKGGVIENIVVVENLAQAEMLFPGYTIIERTDENKHLNSGDSL